MRTLPFLGLGSEQSLREMGDALPDGLFMTDVEGVVTYWNRAAEQITGWRREEAIGTRCSLLAGDPVRGCSCGKGPIRCGLVERARSSKCCTIRTKDGRETLIVKSATPVYAADGRPVGALESFTEVGDLPGVARSAGEARRPSCDTGGDFCGLVGCHDAMKGLYRMVELVARVEATVMILGESGSGKGMVAEAIHRMSGRASGPFVRVSCSADETLLASELFGHVKGAFAGALEDRRGRFQEAHGGTLLLDEIGDLSPVVQGKLLRVIEQRAIERVGDSQPIPVDVRLLCATYRDLRQLVAQGRFRSDLYFRLAVFPLRVPPLREHADDIRFLAERFLSLLRPAGSARTAVLEAGAARILRQYSWPGNVRELQNVLVYAALQAGGGEIRVEHLPPDVRPVPASGSLPRLEVLSGGRANGPVDREAVVAALAQNGWNRSRAAEALGISRVTLWKRMKRHGIAAPGGES
jgi:PAS domain S-box-containing protein